LLVPVRGGRRYGGGWPIKGAREVPGKNIPFETPYGKGMKTAENFLQREIRKKVVLQRGQNLNQKKKKDMKPRKSGQFGPQCI